MTDSAQKTNGFKWQPNAKLLVFALLMLPFLVGLGLWQLERGDEKQQIVDHHARNPAAIPLL
jgi:cytochrome oxidase assembly protein ShyY1